MIFILPKNNAEFFRRRLGLSAGSFLPILLCLLGGLVVNARAGENLTLKLAASAHVDSRGVFLNEIAQSDSPLPEIRLCDAPVFGQKLDLKRAQIAGLLSRSATNFAATNLTWDGADAVEVLRKTHQLNQADVLALLTSTLQKRFVRDKGTLELIMTRPWSNPTVPDEPLTVKILELPTVGVTPSFIVRFQLCTATETVGTWQTSLQAHVWRDVWVARSDLRRGELISDADVAKERRDILSIPDMLAQFSPDDSSLELATSLSSGSIILARNLKARTVLHRGQMADAVLKDGALNITMKVEVLEDGAPGQIVRVRNPVSLRNLSGKVIDNRTIAISL